MSFCARWFVLVITVTCSEYADAIPSLYGDGPGSLSLNDDNALQSELQGLEGGVGDDASNTTTDVTTDVTDADTTVTDVVTDTTATGDVTDSPTTDDITDSSTTDDVTDSPTTDVTDDSPTTDVTDDSPTTDVTDDGTTTDVTDVTPTSNDVTASDETTKSTRKPKPNSGSKSLIKLKDFVYWPNGTVPFYINTDHFDHEQAGHIMQALKAIAFRSCIKFAPTLVPPRDEQHVLVFANPLAEQRCEPTTEGHAMDAPHIVVMGYRCLQKLVSPRTYMMVLRALGLPFEHSRMIRDLYVDVQLENVESGALNLFAKDSRLPPELRSLPYDINSVMHFDERDYSKNGHKTMIIKDKKTKQYRADLTPTDIKKLELIYGPECLQRDRQEKIEICQNFPNAARRKRSIGDKSLRINPDITPPPNILAANVNLEDLGVANETKEVVGKINEIITTIIHNSRKKHCNLTTGTIDVNTAETTNDVLDIHRRLTNLAASLVDNVTNFCEKIESVEAYHQSHPTDRRKRDLGRDRLSEVYDVEEEKVEVEVKRTKRGIYKELINPAPGATPASSSVEDGSGETEVKDPNKIKEEVLKLQEQQKAVFEEHMENITNLEKILRTRTDSLLPETVPLSKINEEFYEDRRWNHGVVNYFIEREMDEDAVSSLRKRLNRINDILEEKTCVKLREVDSDPPHKIKDYLYINDGPDFITGKVGGRQVFGCVELFEDKQHRQFTAMMVMAMLGFYFEVARHDRDKYLKVHNRNIRPDKLHHFEKLGEDATLDLPYDFKSATQPAWAFWRKPGRSGVASVATYKTHDPNGRVMKEMGQNKKLLSEIDIIKINSVYGTKCMDKQKDAESSKEKEKEKEEEKEKEKEKSSEEKEKRHRTKKRKHE